MAKNAKRAVPRQGVLRPRAAIERMAPYVPPTSSRQGKLRLDFNENTAGCSPKVEEALRRALSRELLSIYPEYEDARRKMGAFLGVAPEQLTFTDGTDEAIHVLLNTYVEPGDEVVIPWPAFPMFRFYTELAGAEPVLKSYRQPDLEFPLDELLAAVTPRTRAVLVANPNNPTGGAIGLAEIERILERAPRAAVLIDEAYFEFYRVTALPLFARHRNLFVSRTFSKAYGMAGLRVGCLISNAENMAAVRKGQSPYSVNSLAIICGLAAIEDQGYVESYVEEARASREQLYTGLRELGVRFYPSQANFVLAHFGGAGPEVCRRLRERGILVRDRGKELPGTVRITVGAREQTGRLLRELEKVLREISR